MAEQGGLKVQCFVNDSYVPIDKISNFNTSRRTSR